MVEKAIKEQMKTIYQLEMQEFRHTRRPRDELRLGHREEILTRYFMSKKVGERSLSCEVEVLWRVMVTLLPLRC